MLIQRICQEIGTAIPGRSIRQLTHLSGRIGNIDTYINRLAATVKVHDFMISFLIIIQSLLPLAGNQQKYALQIISTRKNSVVRSLFAISVNRIYQRLALGISPLHIITFSY